VPTPAASRAGGSNRARALPRASALHRVSGMSRIGIIHAALATLALAVVVRAGQVQLWQGDAWAARAARQHLKAENLPAPRGDILDATGMPLVESRELVRLSVAPREVRDRRALSRALARAGVPQAWVRRAIDVRRAWVGLPGRFLPSDVAPAVAMRGVYAEAVGQRVALASDGMRRIVGRVGAEGAPTDGLELALDSVLRGEKGAAAVVRDARGRSFESPTAPGVAPRKGNTVVLTINFALQDIAERALADATAQMGADGGDVVVIDPQTGAVLAMASRRADPRSTAATALTEPFEPGSTLKPFIAAALLARGRARVDEVVNTHDGVWKYNGRTITDSHKAARMTLAEVIQQSSNIGIVQFAERLSPQEEFETLRDLGFGMPTGVPYPSEAAGTLKAPRLWSRPTPASMAMGYEVAVTPLQLAAAYGAIANGGELLEPALVKEVRSPEGKTLFRHERRVVRRVMTPELARQMRELLVGTVERGTAVDADLATFDVAGKTGTARRATAGQGYAAKQYTASFVALFPAQEPQFVILVKLDNPAGVYYGGKTAAPISKVVLEAAIAARDAALDRGALAHPERTRFAPPAESSAARDTLHLADAATPVPSESVPAPPGASDRTLPADSVPAKSVVVDLAAPTKGRPAAAALLPVPDVRGLGIRAAVRRLHEAGFRVQLVGSSGGTAGGTAPSPGTPVRRGSLVRLLREQ
jgi:cell division protein FtsI (penicillin-binding protein 3)